MITVTDSDDPPDLPVCPAVVVVSSQSTDTESPELLASVMDTTNHAIEVG